MLSIAGQEQLRSILRFMLDEREFLSPYGIRALSQFHRDNPYKLSVEDREHRVDYEPANRQPDCLAETPTGVVRSGSR